MVGRSLFAPTSNFLDIDTTIDDPASSLIKVTNYIYGEK